MNKKTLLKTQWMLILFLIAGAAMAANPVPPAQNTPIHLGILIQENVNGVATDLDAYRNFVKALPAGSSVTIGYARAGSVQISQPFTTDLTQAASSIRPPMGFASMAPGSPFLSVKEFVKRFPADGNSRNVLIFVSDGLDWNFGDFSGPVSNNPYLSSAIKSAEKSGINVYSIYAPSGRRFTGTTWLVQVGQNALGYLADETGGELFYSGSTYVSAQHYLDSIKLRIG